MAAAFSTAPVGDGAGCEGVFQGRECLRGEYKHYFHSGSSDDIQAAVYTA